jgi:dGTPase
MNDVKLSTRQDKEDMEQFLYDNGYLWDRYTFSSKSRGRTRDEPEDNDRRTCFQRDVDRIVYSHAYRRLRSKTQAFLLPREPELTTRLIHTEEVTQIARGICYNLRLNHVLAEAIARGHDLGHTPFGHKGEEILTEIMSSLLDDPDYEFHHADYGLEIVDRVEKGGKGMNLTHEVRDGIQNHSIGRKKMDGAANLPYTAEGRVTMWSDKIAYVCGDLDDALRIGFMKRSEFPQSELNFLGEKKSEWINTCIHGLIHSTEKEGDIAFKGNHYEAFETIRQFLYNNAYGHRELKPQFDKAGEMMKLVFNHVMETQFRRFDQSDAAYKTLDVVACMTDRSIVRYMTDNYIPQGSF